MYKSARLDKCFLLLKSLPPVWLAFIGSLLLSVIAYYDDPVINKDGILYIDTARVFLEKGFAATIKNFNWPWFSILVGYTHWLTTLSLENSARFWCAIFMAGTCSLCVASLQERLPKSGYWACLVALAMPAMNQYRGDVLREFGFWFFSILALWLALRWQQKQSWTTAALIQLAVLTAAAFRLEALVLVVALALWQGTFALKRNEWRGLVQINALPLFVGIFTGIWLLISGEAIGGRLGRYLKLINPQLVFAEFVEVTNKFGETILGKYSKDDAGEILFFGMLITILLKFLKMLGPFVIPWFFRGVWPEIKNYLRGFNLFAWVWFLYFNVMVVFFLRKQYVISRHISFLDLLVIPLIVFTLMWISNNFPRGAKLLTTISLIVMLANVVSFSPKKTHYIEAGKWLSENISAGEVIYYDDPRICYYAGWGYPQDQRERKVALSSDYVANYKYFVIEAQAEEPWFQQWLQQQHKRILVDFKNEKGDSALIVGD